MALKIYTKTGDKGSTSLIGGTKVSKSHDRIEAYGTVDELNSHIGLCYDLLREAGLENVLHHVQDRLFIAGSMLACDPGKEIKMQLPALVAEDVSMLEKEIDQMETELAPMKHFILPGGHTTVSQIHIARSVCRRAERCCVKLGMEDSPANALLIQFLNRLSDYLFVLARFTGHRLGVTEIPWVARK